MAASRLFGLSCAFACAFSAAGQGTLDWTFIDAERGGRAIPCEVAYPAGDGPFPTVVFGHGFVMSTGDYGAWITGMVASGYVVIGVETETGLAPSHADFGLDLAYVADAASVELALPCALDDRVALGGHSMGGGAAWLAAATSEQADAVFGFAPAETDPSAIGAAAGVLLPALVFSGSSDGVTPPGQHHAPIYAATASECKAFANLVEGGHCGFADAGSLCDLGEFLFSGMSRERQQEVALERVVAWLDHWFRGGAWSAFEAPADADADVELEVACALQVAEHGEEGVRVWPHPFAGQITLQGLPPAQPIAITNALGQRLWHGITPPTGPLTLDASPWPPGFAFLHLPDGRALPLLKAGH